MANSARAQKQATSLAKREPAVLLAGIATLVSTVLFVAPSLGIPVPSTVQKVVAAGLTLLAGFGIRPLVEPVKR